MDENRRIWPGDPARGEVEMVEERVVWANDVVRVCDDRVRVPGRDHGAAPIEKTQFRLAHATGAADGVVVVPLANDDRVLLVRQFRHSVRMWLHELPRGGGKTGELPVDSARRELREELGCETREITPLGRVVTDSGQIESIPHLFVARVVEGGTPELETGETIDRVDRYRFTELRAACERGDIVDSYTLAAVLRVSPHFDGDRFAWRPDCAPRDAIR